VPHPKKKPSRALPKSERERLSRLVAIESGLRKRGYSRIARIDEAGRGPLAGPVVAAACVIAEGFFFPGIDDSKKLTPTQRKDLFKRVTAHSQVDYGIGIVEPSVIDSINILQATLLAMRRAVENLPSSPDFLIVDGPQLPFDSTFPSRGIIRGDSQSQSIAAASIIAKQTRDQIMFKYHETYPEYGFDSHKGYGTPKHREALQVHGPCPIHRRSFAPIREVFAN